MILILGPISFRGASKQSDSGACSENDIPILGIVIPSNISFGFLSTLIRTSFSNDWISDIPIQHYVFGICICIYAGADISRIPLTLASSEISLFVIRFWDPFGCPYVAFGSDIFRIPSTLASSEIFLFVIHFRDPFGCPDNWPLDSNSLPAKNHSFVQ